MDFTYLSNLSQDKHSKTNNGFDRKRQALPPASKRQPSAQVTSSAVQLFLARKQQEEKQKYAEFQKKKEELLLLRSQSSKNNKKAKLMASRTRDNDFSKIKLTEDEEEAKVKREKELKQKGLRNKVDRMKARIELEERDNQLPRKRKRKSHLLNSDEPLNNVNNINTDMKIEHHVNGIHVKNDMERKISKHRPKPVPVMDYKNLLQVAAKKQYEPVALPDEDFEEESDEYEEENNIRVNSAEKFPVRKPVPCDSLKEDRMVSKQHNILNKNRNSEKARLSSKSSDSDESRQNKENAYKTHNCNANTRLHKASGEHDKNILDNDRPNASLSQKHSQRNSSDSVALHAKENQTIYSSETSKNISHSRSSKYHYDPTNKYNIADIGNTNTSNQDDSAYEPNFLSREDIKKLHFHSQDRTKYQNHSSLTLSSSTENNYSDILAQKRKHERTFRNSIKGPPDRKINSQHAAAMSSRRGRNDQKGINPMATHHPKNDNKVNETTLNVNCSSANEHMKTESSRSFKIPKRNTNNIKPLDNDTPCYYTDEGSNSLDEVKQTKYNKMACSTASNNPISKSNKNSSREVSQEHLTYKNKASKSHTNFNNISEQAIKNKHKSDAPSYQQRTEVRNTIQRSNSKLKENFSHSKSTERSSSNRSSKIINSNEYFTEEGQGKVQHNATIESNSAKNRMKKRNESTLSNEVCQYYTEQFTTGKSVANERTGDVKYHSHKKHHNSEQDNSKTKHIHHERSAVINKHSSDPSYNMKPCKQDKTKVDQPQYFTEDFAAEKTNCKFDRRTVPQKEKQMKHSQYFTEQYASDENNMVKSSEQGSKYDRKSIGHQKERHIKQSHYFTENFAKGENSTQKGSEPNCKYDKRTSSSQKQSQYFTENFMTDERGRTKSKCDERTSAHHKERQIKEPQYFTEHFVTNENNTKKHSDSNCKSNNQIKQNQYFTENFITAKNKVHPSKSKEKPQKEKEINHSQYFTEDFVADEGNTSDINCKYERKSNVPQKEKKTQYFSESYNTNENHMKYKQERNSSVPHTEKPKQFHNNSKVMENISKKVQSKENCYKKVSSVPSHTSNSHSEIHNKMQKNCQTHSSQSESVRRIPKRPREQPEVEPHPNKIHKYEGATDNEVDTINSKRGRSLINHSREGSKTSLSHSESKFAKNQQIAEEIESYKKSDAVRSQVHTSKLLHNKHEHEKATASPHSKTKLKDHCEKFPSLEQSSLQKPERKILPSKEKLLPQNNSSFAKLALPNKVKKVIPASSMAQMMNKKPSQSMPLRETVGAKIQSVNHESSKPKQLLQPSIDAKRTALQKKSDNPPFSREKHSSEMKGPLRQVHVDSKSVVSHQKVISSSQRVERNAHSDHQKSHVDSAHKNVMKKPMLKQDRKMRQAEYDSKIRNRFSRPSPRMFIKRNVDSDEEEEDYDEEEDDMSDFIDDGPIEEDEEDYSRYIREIFGYDKRRYRFEEELDDRDMETSYAQQMKEERRSARIGYLEDLEDMRKEEEEKKRKTKGKK